MNTPNHEASDAAVNDNTIPVLDSPLDTVTPKTDEETDQPHLKVNLGYADDLEAVDESETLEEFVEIHTLSLSEALIDETTTPDSVTLPEDQRHRIATLEAIVFEGYDPAKPTVTDAPPLADDLVTPSPIHEMAETPPQNDSLDISSSTPSTNVEPRLVYDLSNSSDDVGAKKSDNPFLPKQLLDRLNQGKRNLVEEIAQSSAALDASAAILREHARTDRYIKTSQTEVKLTTPSHPKDRLTPQKQKLIDELVDEYLPLLAAELRKRLRKILDDSV
jgi:hypothetical protein